MIAARKNAPFNFVLRRWLGRTLRRRFHNVYVAGAEHLRALDAGRPVVGCVNHTNWWDGFVLYVLSHRLLPHDIFLAMEERNLRRYPFFRWMGVFGVDLTNKSAALGGMRYALGLLRHRDRRKGAPLIWMFVQGSLCRPDARIAVKPGATFLARNSAALLLPIALRYEWLNESRPSIFIRVGSPMEASTNGDELSAALNGLHVRTGVALDPLDLREFEPMFSPGMSMNKRWDYLLHRLRGRPGAFDPQNR